jgi:hypothetical protein
LLTTLKSETALLNSAEVATLSRATQWKDGNIVSIVIIGRERGMILVRAQYSYESSLVAIREEMSAYGDYKSIRVDDRDREKLIELLLKHNLEIQDPDNILDLPLFSDGEYAELDLADAVARLADYETIHGNTYDTDQNRRRQALWGRASEILKLVEITYEERTSYTRTVADMSQTASALTMVTTLTTALNAATRASFGTDGLVEELTIEDALAAWDVTRAKLFGVKPEKVGQKWYPTRDTAMAYIAASLAQGPTVTVNDGVIRRVYKAWPISLAKETSKTYVDDLRIDLASWAVLVQTRTTGDDEPVLMHISAVGAYQKNKAVWASVMDGTRKAYALSYDHGDKGGFGGRTQHAKRQQGKKRYVTDWNDQDLPISRMSHVAITHYTAETPASGQSFLHLVGDHVTGAPDLPWFYRQLDTALTIPIQEQWAAELWAMGFQLGLIHRMPSHNCAAYWVEASEKKWTRVVQALTLGKSLEELGEVDVETVGGEIAEADQLVLEDIDSEDRDDHDTNEEDD